MKAINLQESSMLVSLVIRRWSQHTTDKEATMEVAAHHQSDVSMGNFRKRLLPRDALIRYTGVVNSLRKEHYFLTLPWTDEGYRILSNKGYFEYRKRISALIEQGNQALEEFWPIYEAHKEEMKLRLNGLYKEEDYPSVEALKTKFGVDVRVKPLSSADQFRVKSLGSKEVAAIKAAIEDESKAAVETAIKSVYERLNEVITKAATRLKEYKLTADNKVEGKFRDSLLSNITDLLDVIPALNITNDPKLGKFVEQVRQEITLHSPDVLRDDEVIRSKVVASAEEIMKKMAGYF